MGAYRSARRLLVALCACTVPAVIFGGVILLHWPRANPILHTLVLGPPGAYVADLVAVPRAGTVVVAITEGMVIVDAHRGTLVRRVALPLPNTPVAVVDPGTTRIYVTTVNGVTALDARTGAQVWAAALAPAPTVLAIDSVRGYLYAGWSGGVGCDKSGCTLEDGIISALDERTGHVVASTPLPQQGALQLALDTDAHRLLVVGGDPSQGRARLTVFDLSSGQPLRRAALGGTCAGFAPSPLVDAGQGRAIVPCVSTAPGLGRSPAMPYGLDVLNSRTRALSFVASLFATPPAAAVDEQHHALVVTDSGPINLLTVHQSNQDSAALWVPGGSGRVTLWDLRTGARRWTTRVGPLRVMTSVIVDAARGRVYVASPGARDPHDGVLDGSATLTVLDEQNGSVLRTLALGVNPEGMALDPVTQRLLVMDGGDDYMYDAAPRPDGWAWVPRWLRDHLPFIPRQAHPARRPPSLMTIDTSRL